MRTALRFVWKQYRFEIASMLVLLVGTVIAVQAITMRLDQTRPSPGCMADWRDIEEEGHPCIPLIEAWLATRPLDMHQVIGAVPMIAGIILGSVLVSREIEHRTAQLGWSLSPARRRWLLERVVPVAVTLSAILVLLAVVSDLHEAAIQPGIDPRASFDHYGARGVPLVMRGLAVFAGSVLAGALLGRQLPALIVGGLLAAAIGYGSSAWFPYGTATRWLDNDHGTSGVEEVTDRRIGAGWLTPEGTVLSIQEAKSSSPYPGDDSATFNWLDERFTFVSMQLEGEQLAEVELREGAGLAVFTLVALGASMLVVRHRRPY